MLSARPGLAPRPTTEFFPEKATGATRHWMVTDFHLISLTGFGYDVILKMNFKINKNHHG